MPELGSTLERLRVRRESSRPLDPNTAEFLADKTKGKYGVFHKIFQSLCMDNSSYLNLIVLGDAKPEMEAGKMLQQSLGESRCLLKTICFSKGTALELMRIHAIVQEAFKQIFWMEKDNSLSFMH